MEVFGLPLHVLVIHAAVVLGPVTALLTWAFALLPSWRWLTRLPAVGAAVATVGTFWLAQESGEALVQDRFTPMPSPQLADAIALHSERSDVLWLLSLGLAAVMLLSAVLVGGPSGLASGRGAVPTRGGVVGRWVLPALLVVLGAAVLVWTILTGHAGADAVWGP